MSARRLQVLDGWRGTSILFVLLGHLFPLGPKAWQLNGAVAGAGMAIFFTLSGFLITSVLLRDPDIRRFLIHRIMRIVPLAWLAILVALPSQRAPMADYLPNLLFYANQVPTALTPATDHFWSLCVEVQFYMVVALLVGLLGRRSLACLPVLALAVTIARVWHHQYMTIDTQFRVDEILAGCTLALAHDRTAHLRAHPWLRLAPFVVLPVLVLSAHPVGGALNYVRPYLAAFLVGSTLNLDDCFARRVLESAILKYLATISYALYVIHGCLTATWLASGDVMVKYLKRPLLLAATFGGAHLSTYYYERYFIGLGRRLAGPGPTARPAAAAGAPQ